MSLHPQPNTSSAPQRTVDKGKRRAVDPTESSPLLQSSHRSYADPSQPAHDDLSHSSRTPRLHSKLISAVIVSLFSCLLLLILLAFLIWSYASKAADISVDDVIHNGVTIQGPDWVSVLNATEEGIWFNASYRIGVDAGALIGVNTNQYGESFLESVWKAIGRWGVQNLDRVSVNLSTIHVESSDPPVRLLAAEMPPMIVQLTTNPPDDLSWLTPVSTPLLIKLVANATTMTDFLRKSWKQGFIEVHLSLDRASVHGGAVLERSWRDLLSHEMRSIESSIRTRIPFLPGWPRPGHNAPLPSLSEVLSLMSFSVTTQGQDLTLDATALLKNPVPPRINFTSPILPFTIALPNFTSSIDIASVYTAPFMSTHPNITLNISGNILPLPQTATATLSAFFNRYLSGQPNPIIVSTPLLPGYSVEAEFPAPYPRPQILRNVTIHDMKVRASGGGVVASGTVFARVVLPKGMNLALDIYKVLPDVLVFDGEVPADLPEQKCCHLLPDPLPEHAFGHILPEDWLPSLSIVDDPPEKEGMVYIVSARITDVPLEVLPGRQKEFSNFVGKILFGSGGAVAGLMGTAGVGVNVRGLPIHGPEGTGDLELRELPFRGSVRVGKKDYSI